MNFLLEKTTAIESTFDEEDSHFYLSSLMAKQWHSYSSNDRPLDDVVQAIQTFVLLHACIFLPDKELSRFWSPTPLSVFKFIMDNQLNWHPFSHFSPYNGYTVQGCDWSNGFYYIVSNEDFVIEANLHVDFQTKEQYNYQ